jgi:hypothetical protein
MADNLLLAAIENDDDLLLLSFSRKEESAISYQKLDIEKLTNDQCRTMFRFDRDDIKILSHALQTPEIIICENRTTATNIEGLCIVLRRLAYPSRLDDLEPVLVDLKQRYLTFSITFLIFCLAVSLSNLGET